MIGLLDHFIRFLVEQHLVRRLSKINTFIEGSIDMMQTDMRPHSSARLEMNDKIYVILK